MLGAIDWNRLTATGTSMTTKAALSVRISWPLVWKNIVGMWAAWSGGQMASGTVDWPTTTAATWLATIWLAQSVALPGSAAVWHTTRSIGRPAMPPLRAFQ